MPDTPDSSLTVRNEQSFQLITTNTGADTPLLATKVNLGGQQLTSRNLTVVTIPPAGGQEWVVSGLRGEERLKVLTGVIVDQGTTRAYFKTEYTGQNQPPDCKSLDGLTGDPGINTAPGVWHTDCRTCQYNKWPEDGEASRAKPCSERAELYLLQNQAAGRSQLPVVVRISPGSLRILNEYMQSLSGEGLRRDRVVTDISLTQHSRGYSQAQFTFVRELDGNEGEWTERYQSDFRDLVEGVPGTDIVVKPGADPEYIDTYAEEPPPPTEAPADLIEPDDLPFE